MGIGTDSDRQFQAFVDVREVSQSELETRLNDLDIGHVISSLEQLSLYVRHGGSSHQCPRIGRHAVAGMKQQLHVSYSKRLMSLQPRYFDMRQIAALQGETLQYFTDVQGDLASNEEEYGRNLDGCRSLLDDFNNARTSQQNDVS
ncbi:hypothetical protein F441_10830 [Phytophthora nicotianae CJ01A1]|uniref:Uncharacterized protein n=2 Tax=Phytophthora nicotianae TaxID=4792 RepID=V9F259_PHYNI|nr:hypothetical protein F443_10906 [Phytophthora nicotianae P1569]ETP14241.1 hypothetical protein F441_10830 [Phytophthora nicotianae CJ01A1]